MNEGGLRRGDMSAWWDSLRMDGWMDGDSIYIALFIRISKRLTKRTAKKVLGLCYDYSVDR